MTGKLPSKFPPGPEPGALDGVFSPFRRDPLKFLTSAARRGASVFKMRDVSRHKSMDGLQGYVRDADMFRDHAGAGLL